MANPVASRARDQHPTQIPMVEENEQMTSDILLVWKLQYWTAPSTVQHSTLCGYFRELMNFSICHRILWVPEDQKPSLAMVPSQPSDRSRQLRHPPTTPFRSDRARPEVEAGEMTRDSSPGSIPFRYQTPRSWKVVP